ncbi:MAG: DUF5721 family protein [Butyrivibrio sp.]|nr:DUF5721 family protein [Butyrivibrio sp.]
MIAIKISKQKEFMSKLLTTDLFDSFPLEEATVDTYNTFHIDGKVHKEFYKGYEDVDPGSLEDFSLWRDIRHIALDLIKGKRTPLSFKFVLHADKELKNTVMQGCDSDLSPEVTLLGIIIKFSKGEVVITTGTSFSIFSMDKSIEKAWDAYIPSFLDRSGIDYELL